MTVPPRAHSRTLTPHPPLAHALGACGRHPTQFCVNCRLHELFVESRGAPNRSVSPFRIVDNLRSIARTLRPGYQEDAHEFLAQLLDTSEMHAKKQEPPRGVRHVMRGQLVGCVTCTVCRAVSQRHDPFETLSLEIAGGASLEHMLGHFTAMEVLDGANKYRCEGRCGNALVRAVHLTGERGQRLSCSPTPPTHHHHHHVQTASPGRLHRRALRVACCVCVQGAVVGVVFAAWSAHTVVHSCV